MGSAWTDRRRGGTSRSAITITLIVEERSPNPGDGEGAWDVCRVPRGSIDFPTEFHMCALHYTILLYAARKATAAAGSFSTYMTMFLSLSGTPPQSHAVSCLRSRTALPPPSQSVDRISRQVRTTSA